MSWGTTIPPVFAMPHPIYKWGGPKEKKKNSLLASFTSLLFVFKLRTQKSTQNIKFYETHYNFYSHYFLSPPLFPFHQRTNKICFEAYQGRKTRTNECLEIFITICSLMLHNLRRVLLVTHHYIQTYQIKEEKKNEKRRDYYFV